MSGEATLRSLLAVALALLGGGCASKGDLRQMEANMLAEIRAMRASQDSLNRELRAVVVDSLEIQERRFLEGRSDQQRRLDQVQQSLAQVLDLLEQIERELRRTRAYGGPQMPLPVSPGATGEAADGGPGRGAGGDDAAQALYNSAQNQFNRGAYETARTGFAEYLRLYPDRDLAPDAQFYLARTYEETADPALALAEYARVLELYPNSRRAPSALYASGRIELDRGNTQDAIEFFSRVVRGYPNSDEAILAEQRLSDLRR
ncbi:MAG: tetratricopeptide repeat protein [Gemmatimonadota bacterium]|jgi:tol-pal system protein YbgF|nr:MAG: tetratricopeptide repeat protein [Gemmatimonadota bacterium]